MVYDICLDVASLLIMLIIAFGSGRQYKDPTEQNLRFRQLSIVLNITLIFDMAGSIFIGFHQLLSVSVNMVIQSASFALISFSSFLYARYMEIFIPEEKQKPIFKMLNKVVLAVYYLCHILNYFNGLIFYFDEDGIYCRGKWYLLVYAVPLYLFLYGIILMFKNRRYVEKRQYYATMSLVPFITVGAVLQFSILSNFLVILFAITLAVTIIFFNLETPDYRKLIETMDQLEQSRREATEANEAKSNFLAQMSHEIRTPINAVLGMNEMILRETKEEQTAYYASNAYNAGKTLLSIINDILDISKIEAGKLEIVEKEYSLYSLINDCYHMTAGKAGQKNLDFIVTVDEKMPSKLIGDMFHIRQVVINLLTNAVKYTETGTVEFILSGLHMKDNTYTLQMSIKDTGIGLSEENRQKLFDSFQRFDMEHNQSIEGTGLGLAICKQLAERMGGKIGVESIYGQGSTFCFEVPQRIGDTTPIGEIVLDSSTEQIKPENRKKFIAETACVLVVDDVEMNLIVFRSLLKEHKLSIDFAMSGKECLSMVQKKKYDIIFMDHMMPEMDGMETYVRMREMEHENKDTPVIMLTANAIVGEKEKYLAAGFSSYLSKPIRSDKLDKILLEHLPVDKVTFSKESEDEFDSSIPFKQELLKDRISDIKLSEIDLNLGLTYAGGSEETYLVILNSYVENGDKRGRRITELYEKENWKDYVIEVHGLKSASLTVGAKKLSETAAMLEKAGKDGDYEKIRSENGKMLEQYEEILNIGHEILKQFSESIMKKDISGGLTDKGSKEISRELLDDYKKRIEKAAGRFDSDTIVSLCDELSEYSYENVSLYKALQKIKTAAQDFECELALEYAKSL